MVGPWIHSLWKSGRRLSDIEYLSIKEFDGKTRYADSAGQTAAGDGATLTAATGKDMYLAKATVNVEYDGTGTTVNVKAVLDFNGTVEETWDYSIAAISSVHAFVKQEEHFEFKTNIGRKAVADDIIKIEIITATNAIINTSLLVFEEATGASPAI